MKHFKLEFLKSTLSAPPKKKKKKNKDQKILPSNENYSARSKDANCKKKKKKSRG
jgi:hypothetical protein